MNQNEADYYIVATAKLPSALAGVGILHYSNSNTRVTWPLRVGSDTLDLEFSLNQARSIRWNVTMGAARPNPQGPFNVQNMTLSQTFILQGSLEEIQGLPRYTVDNVSYYTVDTPLKLADNFGNGVGNTGWAEFVFKNNLDAIDSWHLDGYGFFVVAFGKGDWTPDLRKTSYNLFDPVVRSTVQVYPRGWTAVYAFLHNPGMWNLRSQLLNHWYLGQELYVRIHDDDPDPAKERSPPDNLLRCGSLCFPIMFCIHLCNCIDSFSFLFFISNLDNSSLQIVGIFYHSKAPASAPVPASAV
ncbi:hypothetical protein L6164_006898 [Bauhinia variegata]|uniref:Uncharacterized protein n=1 Tax=Bauhinia variegata TaxID=167791 RepID=A0ACB9Q1B2_BAUVA|nr:hypothetical protein L6164_006898 [Bauhinia variegata]